MALRPMQEYKILSEFMGEVAGTKTAFELLLEEIEQVADGLNREGSRAFDQGRYDEVAALLDRARQCTDFRSRIRALREEWQSFAPVEEDTLKESVPARRGDLGRLNKGLRTPDELYRLPLLQSLIQIGGRSNIRQVTDLVGERMKSVLNPYDHEPLPSDPDEPRWRNTVAWMRLTLVQEGLMRNDSPRGTWEITDAGREAATRNGHPR